MVDIYQNKIESLLRFNYYILLTRSLCFIILFLYFKILLHEENRDLFQY